MAEKASTRLFSVSLRSSDRDETIYPTASHYALEFPAIDNVVGVQVASIELPEYDTHYTIQTNLNDKFTFSEGLRIDFNSVVSSVDQISGLDLFPNQVCIREGSNNFVVSIPAYLTEITSFSSNNLVTPDLACDAGWRKCWLDWQASNPTAPALSVVCSTAGYVGQLVANSLGTKLSITADEAKFRYGYVHLPPVSTAEICSFLSFAFQNYSTYSSTPSSRPSTYTFAYKHGRVCVESTNTTSSLHFVTTANAAQTPWYGSQNNGFATRMMLNNAAPGITSMMYMLGFSSSNRQTSQLKVLRRQAELTVSGFIADQPPRFLFEARLPQGVYTPADLVTQLPIAMNPLNFVQTSSQMGAGYFGFCDSTGRESLIVINSGRYTPETLCQAVEYALNRQDVNAPYYSTNRFSYGAVMLNFTDAQAWPNLTESAVVYSVVYDYTTQKFTIMSASATVKPFDPSTATVLSSQAGPVFGLLFDPTSVARIAAQVSDLSSMCVSANLDRMSKTFGMAMKDYKSANQYVSDKQVFIPKIDFPLSVNGDVFRFATPSTMGIGGSATSVGAGTPKYLFPAGTYAVTGATPPVRSINLSSQCQPSMTSTTTNYSTLDIGAPNLTITVPGYFVGDYTISSAGSNLAVGTYLAMDESGTGDVSASSTIVRVDTVTYDSTAALATFTVMDVGVGTQRTGKYFDGIYSDDMLRMTTITNMATTKPHMLISQHANQVSSTNKAYMTTKPFGFQISDIVHARCISSALMTAPAEVTRVLTVPQWLGPNRGLLVGQSYATTGSTNLAVNQFYLVAGGGRNAVVQATSTTAVKVVEAGSQFYQSPLTPGTQLTFNIRGPIMYHAWQGIVVQQANSGAHFTDSNNSEREQFMACVPYLSQNLSCTPAKTVDGACIRLRVPSTFNQNQSPSPVYLSGNLNFVNEFYQARLDVHIEDLAGLKANHAGTILGVGKANLAMSSTLSMPNAINLDAVSYVMLKFIGLNNQRSNQIHWTDSKMLGDLVTKVVLGAPTSIVRGLLSSVEFAKQRIGRLELAFYMPDGQTLYDFHGLEHSLTLNFMIRDPVAKRKFDQV